MSDLVGNPEDRFSRVAAQIVLAQDRLVKCNISPGGAYFWKLTIQYTIPCNVMHLAESQLFIETVNLMFATIFDFYLLTNSKFFPSKSHIKL